MKYVLALAAIVLILLCLPADASRRCKVLSVSDGDTFTCVMSPPLWGPYHDTKIRVAGIDTPESSMSVAKCEKEARLGKIAKAEIKRRIPAGQIVRITWSGEIEKWGRVLAIVKLPDGKDWAAEMIRLGMARPYTKANLTKSDWCS
jgi:endonuclease YncB( thermonuclease family)